MKIKKYLNNKISSDMEFYSIRLANKKFKILQNRELEKIISSTAISRIKNWEMKNGVICLEYEVEFKILYLISKDSKIYLLKDKAFYYEEININYKLNKIYLNTLIKEGRVEVETSTQEIFIINNKQNIKIIVPVLNWININHLPNTAIYIIDNNREANILFLNKYTTNIENCIALGEEKIRDIFFSKKGNEIFFVCEKNNNLNTINSINIIDKKVRKLVDINKQYIICPLNENEIIYIQKMGIGIIINIFNTINLSIKELIRNEEYEVKEVCFKNDYICMSIKDKSLEKIIVMNKKGEIIKSILGIYRNIEFLEEERKIIAIKDTDIYIINITNMSNSKISFNFLELISFKILDKKRLIVFGKWNGLNQILLVNIETSKQTLLFETNEEIYEFNINNNNEVLVSCRHNKIWILRKVSLECGVENIGEIKGEFLKMIVRGK